MDSEPTVTPELIGILAVGATVIGLMLTFRRDARADSQALRADNQRLRADVRADMESFRTEIHSDMDSFRAEVRTDIQNFRTEVRADLAEVRGDLADLRKDVQALTERTSRVEGVIEGFFAGHGPSDRRDDAA